MHSSESQQIKTKVQESEYSDSQNVQSYSHSEYQGIRKQKPKKLQTCDIIEGKWSEDEKMKYILFVYHHEKIFKSKTKRKNLRVFKTLSEYLGSRTPRQCRSHFQKLMNRFKNLKKMIEHHQKQLGHSQFTEAHRGQMSVIQSYPIQSQNSQKLSVACQSVACQTDQVDVSRQYEVALQKIKFLQRLVCQSNFLLSQTQKMVHPQLPFYNFSLF